MITQRQIDELVAVDGGGHPILSVFLDFSPERQAQRVYQGAFTALAQQCEAHVPDAWRKSLDEDVARVRRYLATAPHEGTGLALYSCTARDLWRAFPLPVVVADAIQYDSHPRIRPLLDIRDEMERFALAVVDKEKARLFTINGGQIEEERGIADVVPGRHKQSGREQSRMQSHHDNAVQQHMKHVVEQLDELLEQRPFRRLLIVGPNEATTELVSQLPGPLRDRLGGTQPGEFFASNADILAHISETVQRLERDDEAQLVNRLLEYVGAGGRGALGIDDSLNAVRLGQVETLLATDEAVSAGMECGSCGALLRSSAERCPWCGGDLAAVDDLIERAIIQTLKQSGSVEIVHGDAAARLLDSGNGVGAILRYTDGPAG